MGNYISCTLNTATRTLCQGIKEVAKDQHDLLAHWVKKRVRTSQEGRAPIQSLPWVVLPTGDIRQFNRHTNAAELMLNIPGYFLVNSGALHVGHRFSPLSFDEELEMGNVYVLFPMRRLNSIVTAADMGTLLLTAKWTSGGKVRILLELVAAPAQPQGQEAERDALRLSLEEMEEDLVGEFKAKLSVCKSWKPTLEMIIEEPIPSSRQT